MAPDPGHLRWAIGSVLVAATFGGLAGCAAPVGEAPTAPITTAATAPVSSPATSPQAAPPAEAAPPFAEALQQWEAEVGDHFTESARALEQVASAADSEDEAAMSTGCQRLHDTNAEGLQGHLPTPDPELTRELQRMIDDMNVATHACLRFALARRQVDASVYQDYLARAMAHLQRAKVILDADRAGR